MYILIRMEIEIVFNEADQCYISKSRKKKQPTDYIK